MATREVRRFGAGGVEFVFDSESGELTGQSGTTRLRPQAATVLSALVARPNELVTREELKKLVWPDTVVEADQGLNFCIRQIRAALGDEAENGKFIETLPRRGYRFVAATTKSVDAGPTFSQPREPWTPRFRALVAVGFCVIGCLAALAWFLRDDTPAMPAIRIAVIPFAAPESDGWMNDLNREIVEHLIVDLTSSPQGFGVVGPVTTASLVNDPRPHTELGRVLGVDLVISGRMRLSDSTLFVQGIRTTDGAHTFAWRERVWNRAADSISASVSSALNMKLAAEQRAP